MYQQQYNQSTYRPYGYAPTATNYNYDPAKAAVLQENFGHLAVDRNNDNLITESDFVISARANGSSEDTARSAFRRFDRNRNGYLDNTELSNVNSHLTRLYFDGYGPNRNIYSSNPQYQRY